MSSFNDIKNVCTLLLYDVMFLTIFRAIRCQDIFLRTFHIKIKENNSPNDLHYFSSKAMSQSYLAVVCGVRWSHWGRACMHAAHMCSKLHSPPYEHFPALYWRQISLCPGPCHRLVAVHCFRGAWPGVTDFTFSMIGVRSPHPIGIAPPPADTCTLRRTEEEKPRCSGTQAPPTFSV